MGDPGYVSKAEPNVLVPPRKEDCEKHSALAGVADIHRRHRFLVEYCIGASKMNWPVRALANARARKLPAGVRAAEKL